MPLTKVAPNFGRRTAPPQAPCSSATEQPNLTGAVQLGDKLIFTATDKASGTEPWVTRRHTAGTMLLKDIVKGTASPTLSGFTVLGDKLIFQSIDAANKVGPTQLWSTDGTTTGTVQLGNGTTQPDPARWSWATS